MKLKKGADVLGNEIKPGDYIVYGAAKGRCAGLNIGRIFSCEKAPKDRWNSTGTKYRAMAVQVDYGEYVVTGMQEYAANPKPRLVTLTFSERICVIPESLVPIKLQQMLAYT